MCSCPRPSVKVLPYEKDLLRCEQKKTEDPECCTIKAFYDNWDILEDGKFSMKKLVTNIQTGTKESDFAVWTPVIESASKTCETLGLLNLKSDGKHLLINFNLVEDPPYKNPCNRSLFAENLAYCIHQEMYLSCPAQVYKTNEKEYKNTKTFVQNKIKKQECGAVVKQKFLLDPSFWMRKGKSVEENGEDDE